MKTPIAITLFFLCIIQTSQAQSDSIEPGKIYKTWIKNITNPGKMKGVLYEIKDSSIVVSNSLKKQDYREGRYDVSTADVRNIGVMKIRKKGNIGKGAVIGTVAGLIIGGALGVMTYNNHTRGGFDIIGREGETLIVLGTSLMMGAGIGLAFGSSKITIPINGSREQFDRNRSMLDGYSLKHNPQFENKTFSKLRDSLVDIDGNLYHTLALGSQVWMAENLAVTRFREGSEIPGVTGDVPGSGRQYDWSAVHDSRKLCPSGWHVPSRDEWTSLINSLGGKYNAGKKMEESFSGTGQVCQWWSSTEQDADNVQSLYLNNKTVGIMFTGAAKSSGLPVRCIRD